MDPLDQALPALVQAVALLLTALAAAIPVVVAYYWGPGARRRRGEDRRNGQDRRNGADRRNGGDDDPD